MVASQFGHSALLAYLIDQGGQIQGMNQQGMTPLLLATRFGATKATEILVNAGAYIQVMDIEGDTPFHWAVRVGRMRAVTALLDVGADIHLPNSFGVTPLFRERVELLHQPVYKCRHTPPSYHVEALRTTEAGTL